MTIHKKILEWQAAHPNITWIGWGIVWAIVLVLLFWPSRSLNPEHRLRPGTDDAFCFQGEFRCR